MTGQYVPPLVDWWAAAPVLAVLLTAVIGILIEAFAPRAGRRVLQLIVAMGGLAIALVFLAFLWGGETRYVLTDVVAGMPTGMVLDQVTLFFQIALVVMGALCVIMLLDRGGSALDPFAAAPATRPDSPAERAAERAGRQVTEIFPLTMFAIGGMMIFASAADLLTMFVALEVFSLPLYILCGLARNQRLRSQEASLKYFLLGAFSSAIFLFGIALMYGAAGTLNLGALSNLAAQAWLQAQQSGQQVAYAPLIILASLLMLVALLFKVGAVPFHSWTPDAYDGAPTPVTAFMAACTKAAAFGAILRLLLPPTPTADGRQQMPGLLWFFSTQMQTTLIIVAGVTMVVGSVVAIKQNDVKRMLAYSAVAHAGFILVGVASYQVTAISGVLFYVLVYGLSSIAAFGIVNLVRVRNADGSVGQEAKDLSQWDGLGRRSPVLAACFSILMLGFAGFPLTSGFIAKFGVFAAAVAAGTTPMIVLAVLGVLMSAVAASFYLRVIVRMYFVEVDADAAEPTVVIGGGLTGVAVAVGVIATILFGVLPGPLLDAAGSVLAVR